MARLDRFFPDCSPMPVLACRLSHWASACSVSSADSTTCRSTPSSSTVPKPPTKAKSSPLAALLSWIGILLGVGSLWPAHGLLHLKPPQIFLFGAVLSLAGTVYCVRLMPDSLLRFLLWCATHSILPHPRSWPRQHSRKRRRALRLQPRFVCGCRAVAGFDRPAGAHS